MKVIAERSRITTGVALHYIGRIRLAAKDFEAAITLLEQSWKVHRYNIGIYHVQTARVILDLAKAYFGKGGMSYVT